jgi:hypothetical protein
MPRTSPNPYIEPTTPWAHEASVLPRINPSPTWRPTKVPTSIGHRIDRLAKKKSFSRLEAKRLAPIEIKRTIPKGNKDKSIHKLSAIHFFGKTKTEKKKVFVDPRGVDSGENSEVRKRVFFSYKLFC